MRGGDGEEGRVRNGRKMVFILWFILGGFGDGRECVKFCFCVGMGYMNFFGFGY